MDVIKRIINKLPFPVILALGIIIITAWIIKQYYGWKNYGNIFHNKLFIAISIICLFNLASYYSVRFTFKIIDSKKAHSFSNSLVLAVSDFVGHPELGSSISDEIEEALLTEIRENNLNLKVLEGVIKTPISGPTEAQELAKQHSLDLIIWGKLINYGSNDVKLIPKIYIANPIEDIKLRGRNLETKIINPSDISLREESAIDYAQFTTLTFGVINFNQGKYEQAIDIFSSIKDKYEAEANFYLGLCYYLMDSFSWDNAVEHIKHSIKLYPDFGIAYLNLGMIYVDVGFLHQANDVFLKAEKIGKHKKDIELVSGASSGLGLYYMQEKDYKKAEGYFRSSLNGYKKLGSKNSIANQYGNLALSKLKQGRLDKAKDFLKMSLSIHRDVENWLGEANDLSNLGISYREFGNYSTALEYQKKALDIFRVHNYTKGTARELGNIGINYFYQKDYNAAESIFKEQLEMFDKIKDLGGKAKVLKMLGEIQLFKKAPDRAKAYFEESLALYLQIGYRAAEGELMYSLSITYRELGETEKALKYLEAASRIHLELGNAEALRNQVSVLLNSALIYSNIHAYDEAIKTLNWALKISDQIHDYSKNGIIYYYLGEIYENKKDFNAAIQKYKKALELFVIIGEQEMAKRMEESIKRLSSK